MRKKGESIIIQTAFRYAIPLIFLYAIYVLTHGEYSPGGGFQAGALLAMVVVLSRLVEGDKAQINISGNKAFILCNFPQNITADYCTVAFLECRCKLLYALIVFGLFFACLWVAVTIKHTRRHKHTAYSAAYLSESTHSAAER